MVGDTILSADHKAIPSQYALLATLREVKIGQTFKVHIRRGTQELDLDITAGKH